MTDHSEAKTQEATVTSSKLYSVDVLENRALYFLLRYIKVYRRRLLSQLLLNSRIVDAVHHKLVVNARAGARCPQGLCENWSDHHYVATPDTERLL